MSRDTIVPRNDPINSVGAIDVYPTDQKQKIRRVSECAPILIIHPTTILIPYPALIIIIFLIKKTGGGGGNSRNEVVPTAWWATPREKRANWSQRAGQAVNCRMTANRFPPFPLYLTAKPHPTAPHRAGPGQKSRKLFNLHYYLPHELKQIIFQHVRVINGISALEALRFIVKI